MKFLGSAEIVIKRHMTMRSHGPNDTERGNGTDRKTNNDNQQHDAQCTFAPCRSVGR